MSVDVFIQKARKNIKSKNNMAEVERNIENDFVKYAKLRGCLALKLVLLSGRGFPDRTVIIPGGKIFFIEFKRRDMKLTPHQIKYQKMLTNIGLNYYVCDQPQKAEFILRRELRANEL